jgi:hypothetical protein
MAGLEASALRPIANALSKARQAAILLDPVPGRMVNVCAAASAASALANVVRRLMPMFRYGNAVAAARVGAALGALRAEEVLKAALDGKVQLLLCIGLDVMRLLSAEDAARLRTHVATLAVASAFRNASTEQANVVLPIGTWFESGGTALDAAGNRCELSALLPPPAGAVSVRELCGRVAAEMGASVADESELPLAEAFQGAGVRSLHKAGPLSGKVRLVARSDSVDFDFGSPSRTLAWPMFVEPTPELTISAEEARSRGLAPRSTALLRADGREARATVRLVDEMPRGMAAVSTAFAETRALFQRTAAAEGAELTWTDVEVVPEAGAPSGMGIEQKLRT